jgi:hypothetical protein
LKDYFPLCARDYRAILPCQTQPLINSPPGYPYLPLVRNFLTRVAPKLPPCTILTHIIGKAGRGPSRLPITNLSKGTKSVPPRPPPSPRGTSLPLLSTTQPCFFGGPFPQNRCDPAATPVVYTTSSLFPSLRSTLLLLVQPFLPSRPGKDVFASGIFRSVRTNSYHRARWKMTSPPH